jgi:ACS family hexuronate transporter-like MFS transporter
VVSLEAVTSPCSDKDNTASPYRWVICAILFFATTINYIDRQILGILAPVLQYEIGWSEFQYSQIVTAFQAAYALGLLVLGWIIDRVGSRLGLLAAVTFWSIASMAHGLAGSVTGFALARFGLGLAEAGNFPASVKAVSEWFPKRERAFAIGIFNSGSNIGAIVAPLSIPWIALTWGWRVAFFATGALGLVWIILAIALFRPARNVVGSENVETGCLSWRTVAKMPATWGFAAAKFLTDPIWWFYLYWTPKYLGSQFGVTLSGLAAPLVTIYIMADIGSVLGGWLSADLIKRGASTVAARQRVMLWCACCALVVIGAGYAQDLWTAVLLLSVATAAHQAWSANLFATVTDIFPKAGVASVTGIGGMVGAIGGMLIATVTGLILEYTGSYIVPFVICSVSYLVSWMLLRSFYRSAP